MCTQRGWSQGPELAELTLVQEGRRPTISKATNTGTRYCQTLKCYKENLKTWCPAIPLLVHTREMPAFGARRQNQNIHRLSQGGISTGKSIDKYVLLGTRNRVLATGKNQCVQLQATIS